MSAPQSFPLVGKRVVVVGLGLSGVAACRLLVSRGAKVTATDCTSLDAASEAVRALAGEGVTLALGGHDGARLIDADLIVVSPGVPAFPELETAEAAGVPIWGEVELSVRAVNEAALAAGVPHRG